jgi:hypothetical protein
MDMLRSQKGLFSQVVWFDEPWILIVGIRIALDVHPNWVVLQMDVANTFNIISHKAIF